MKKPSIFCAAILLLFNTGCKKVINDPKTGLPVATQIGAGNFAAHVNGESWIAGYNVSFVTHDDPVQLTYSPGTFTLNILIDNNKSYPIFFSSLAITLTQGQSYSLQTTAANSSTMTLTTLLSGIGARYAVTPPLTGQMVITKFDPVNKIVAGTLSFDLISTTGEKIEVRDGWFDSKYL